MIKQLFSKNSIVFILTLILIFSNFGFVYAFWASEVEGSNNQTTGSISLGEWIPADFIGVSQTGEEPGMIRLDQVTSTGDYILMTDIDWKGDPFTPIGGTNGFQGNFYGNGKKIYDMKITSNQEYLGLFSKNSGIISGVSLEDIEITLSSTSLNIHAGGIAGENTGFILNSYTTGSITITSEYQQNSSVNRTLIGGGITARNLHTVKNSHSSIEVTVTTRVNIGNGARRVGNALSIAGGLIGENLSTISVFNTYATGKVEANSSLTAGGNGSGTAKSYAGGLIGFNNTSTAIHRSFATGNVDATAGVTNNGSFNRYIGGLVGFGTAIESYRFESQVVTNNTNTLGSLASLSELRTITGTAAPLAFSTSTWEITTTELPRLKGNKY